MKTYKGFMEDFLVGSAADMQKKPDIKSHRHPRIVLTTAAQLAVDIVREHAFPMLYADKLGTPDVGEAVTDAIDLAEELYKQLVARGLAFELPELKALATELYGPQLLKETKND
jgi:hypothetical protein